MQEDAARIEDAYWGEMGTSFGPSVRSEAGRENVILRGNDQSGEAAKGVSSSSG